MNTSSCATFNPLSAEKANDPIPRVMTALQIVAPELMAKQIEKQK